MEPNQIAEILQQLMQLLGIVFGTDSEVLQTILAVLTTLSVVIGSASVIVLALEKIAKVTPTTKDDLYVGKAKKLISKIVAVLDLMALNPDKSKAREPRR